MKTLVHLLTLYRVNEYILCIQIAVSMFPWQAAIYGGWRRLYNKEKNPVILINRNFEMQYVEPQLPQSHNDEGACSTFIIDHNSSCDLLLTLQMILRTS